MRLVSLAVIAGALEGSASACSCSPVGYLTLLPEDGAEIGPDDAFVLYASEESLFYSDWFVQVLDLTLGAEIEHEILEELSLSEDSAWLWRGQPAGGWEEGHEYRIEIRYEADERVFGAAQLHVGSNSSSEPAPISIRGLGRHHEVGDDSCGIDSWLKIDIQAEENQGAYYEIEVSPAPSFEAPALLAAFEPGTFRIGSVACDGNLYGLEPESDYFVRGRAVALSGDASPWSEAALLEAHPDDEGACSGCIDPAGRGGPLGWALAGLALAVRRRSWS